MSEPSLPEESIFAQALELGGADREAFLDQACAEDPALRAGVEALLRANAKTGDMLDLPETDAITNDYSNSGEAPGSLVGTYKLLEQIGEGGFGVVFLAEQTQSVRRKVALKVLKAGMDTRQVVARFEAERQALAIMDHPNIARVFDGGSTPSGRPYFVMELVKGTPITEFCDQNHLLPRQRLELFVTVCQAVQHAHQKGIIHRDLKPSNILVSRHDMTPMVKVIDFGVAKALGQELTDKTLFTGVSQMIGTPLYMSPEQAGMSDLDVDTRSDIYSLGVLLYELLTGTTPFSKERFKKAAYDEIRRIIREEDPPRPSTRLSDSKDSLPSISAQRQTEPGKLTRLVRGELDWIAMKALEKDRNHRYETANGLAADVQRYLADEPVQACPPSVGYRLRKFARRNRTSLVTASIIGVALLLAVGSLGWVLRDREAGRVRTTTEVNQFLQRAESLYADNNLPDAVAEVQKARGVLESGRGDEDLDRRVRQWLTDLDTAGRLEDMRLEWFEHGERLRVITDYSKAFRDYGIDVEALPPEEAAARIAASRIGTDLLLALEDWRTTWTRAGWRADDSLRRRLQAVIQAADSDSWRQRCRRAGDEKDLAALRKLAASTDLTGTHTRSLMALSAALWEAGAADEAIDFLRKVQFHHPGHVHVNYRLADALTRGRAPLWDEAVGFLRGALAVRPKSIVLHGKLGIILRQQGKLDEAIAACRKAIEFGPNDSASHNNLGAALEAQGKLDAAIPAYRKAIKLNPMSAIAYNNLGFALSNQRKLDEAIDCYHEAIRINPNEIRYFINLSVALSDQGKSDDALAACHKAIKLDPNHAQAHGNLGHALSSQGKFDEAIVSYQTALVLDPKNVEVYVHLGDALADQGKLDGAITAYRKAIELDSKVPRGHNNLGLVLRQQGKLEEAITCYRKAIEVDSKYVPARGNLGSALHSQGKFDEAITCYESALKLDPKNFRTHNNLGNVLKAQRNLEGAIASYRKATELEPKDALSHINLGNALKAQGKLEEAITSFQKVIEIDPKHHQGHNILAWELATCAELRLRDPAKAVTSAKWAVNLAPKRRGYWNTLGVAHYRADNLDDSIAALLKSMELSNGGDGSDWFFLAMVCWRQAKMDEARKWFERAVEWMDQKAPKDEELRRFRAEAAELMGVKKMD